MAQIIDVVTRILCGILIIVVIVSMRALADANEEEQ